MKQTDPNGAMKITEVVPFVLRSLLRQAAPLCTEVSSDSQHFFWMTIIMWHAICIPGSAKLLLNQVLNTSWQTFCFLLSLVCTVITVRFLLTTITPVASGGVWPSGALAASLLTRPRWQSSCYKPLTLFLPPQSELWEEFITKKSKRRLFWWTEEDKSPEKGKKRA